MRTVLALSLGLCLASALAAGEVEIQGSVDPPGPSQLGDRLTVRWEVSHDKGVKIESDLTAAALKALSDAGVEVVGSPVQSRGPKPGESQPGRTETQWLSVEATCFTTGVHKIPSFSLRYTDAKGASRSLSSVELEVTVASTLKGGKTEARPIKDPLPYPAGPLLPAWAVAILVLLAALAVWLFRRWTRRAAPPPPPPVPADVEALGRIDTLVAEGLVAAGHVKEFCDRLSDILRAYLGRRFGLKSMGETSCELVDTLKTGGHLGQESMNHLEGFLDECDLAKFAKHCPPPEQIDGLVQTARGLVETTRPPVVGQEVKP